MEINPQSLKVYENPFFFNLQEYTCNGVIILRLDQLKLYINFCPSFAIYKKKMFQIAIFNFNINDNKFN